MLYINLVNRCSCIDPSAHTYRGPGASNRYDTSLHVWVSRGCPDFHVTGNGQFPIVLGILKCISSTSLNLHINSQRLIHSQRMKTVDQNVQSMKLFKFNMNSQNDYIIIVICKITYISIMHRFNSNKSETSGSVH